jgi:glycosyltransferase involved in cell wall biosynthesis
MDNKKLKRTRWFIIAHCFNADGVAASQTITDRLPYLKKQGVDFVVLSAPTGIKTTQFPHYQVMSPSPSGVRYEMRFVIKNKVKNKVMRSILKGLSTIVCAPFYLVEKIFLQFESQWSWFLSASIKGCFIINKYRPALLYSTAGPPTTHLTGYILNKIYRIPWMAELHDPLILDDEQRKWHKYYFNRFVEKIVCNHATIVVYFTNRALENANRRHPIKNMRLVVRPGANPPDFHNVEYRKTEKIHFGHFGSLSNTRNLEVLIMALHELIKQNPDLKKRIALDIYGSELDAVSRKTLRECPLEEVLIEHGRVEYDPVTGKSGRQIVMEAMKTTDVLVILHGTEGNTCYEYIPSKLYEYLLTGRPILGLITSETELEEFLIETRHTYVDKNDVSKVKNAIRAYIDLWSTAGLPDRQVDSPFTVEATVNKLIAAVSDIDAATQRNVD